MAGSIVRGDQIWFKATILWGKLIDDSLPRLPAGSRAQHIVRTQREAGVYLIDVTDESSATLADLRRAVEESRDHFGSLSNDEWDMPFTVEVFLDAIDELIALLMPSDGPAAANSP